MYQTCSSINTLLCFIKPLKDTTIQSIEMYSPLVYGAQFSAFLTYSFIQLKFQRPTCIHTILSGLARYESQYLQYVN
jgi:hypothetical protein